MVTPAMVVQMVTAVATALTELLKFYQTPDGQKVVEQMLTDRAKWDAFWADAGANLKKFFSGDLFKQ